MFKEIARQTAPAGLYDSVPPASCREKWERIPESYRKRLIEEGEKWMDYPFLPIYATDFMEFTRTGNRSHYEEKLFERRIALNALVMAECAQHEGRFLDAVINGLFVICEEAAWQLPAHNTYIRDTPQLILPDVTRPVVDLFAAETGAVVGMAEYLLREELSRISPAVSVLVNHNLETRIFTPYLTEHFWWMGDGKSHMNNWTSWCTQNVLAAAFTRELNKEVQKAVFQKACRSLDYFLDEYGEDGCCDEGAQYYRHAGLTLWGGMEILNRISRDAFIPLYQEVKICNIASYIMKVHAAGPYYINFADCSPMAGPCSAREYLFGKYTGNTALMAFAAEDYQKQSWEERLLLEEHSLLYRVWAAFCHEEMTQLKKSGKENLSDCYFSSAGLFIARDQEFCLAVKAGDNGDSHNHNDVGSFTVYQDQIPLFIDVGVESYTKKTFSPQRYEIWTMQSQYHNLPTFGTVMEKDGEEFQASAVNYGIGEETSWIEMELSKAYPKGTVKSYVRKACLEKGKRIVITDICGESEKPAVLSLMTYERPETRWDQKENQDGCESDHLGPVCAVKLGEAGECIIEGAAEVVTEEIPITDPRLKKTWKHNIFRTRVTFRGEKLRLVISGKRQA